MASRDMVAHSFCCWSVMYHNGIVVFEVGVPDGNQ